MLVRVESGGDQSTSVYCPLWRSRFLMVLVSPPDRVAQQGDHEGCIMRCHKILRKDRCREDAHRRLMRSYARLGQRSQALHWYKVCEETLMTVLELRPS